MVLELMDADGTYRAVVADSTSRAADATAHTACSADYFVDGTAFYKYREAMPGVTAYTQVPPETPFSECVQPPLPMPLGAALYPVPVLWETSCGLATFVTDEKRKVTLRGLFSSWEDSGDEASDVDDGAIIEDDLVDSENDELADEIVSEDDDEPSEEDDALQDD